MPTRTFPRPLRRTLVGSLAATAVVAGLASSPGPAFAAGRAARGAAAAAATGAAAATTSTTLVAGSPTTVSPGSSATSGGPVSSPSCALFSSAQQLVESELAGRVTQLDTLETRVDGAAQLTPSDKARLVADITATELPGIEALQTQVEGDTTCVELRANAREMVLGYRVYLVMTPQTDLTVVNDAEIAAGTYLAGLEPTIASELSYDEAHGIDVSNAQAAFTAYQSQVTAAQGLATPAQSATLLAQTPAGAPANLSVFLGARTNLVNGHDDLQAARNDLAQIIADVG